MSKLDDAKARLFAALDTLEHNVNRQAQTAWTSANSMAELALLKSEREGCLPASPLLRMNRVPSPG